MNKTHVGKNTFYNTIKTLFGIIFPLITFSYISRVLGVDNVGKITFGNSVVSYFSLISSLGITTYAIRECSKVRDNRQQLSETASQIISINIISTLVAYVLLFTVLIFVKKISLYSKLILIQSISIVFTTLGADWLNSAMEDFKYITVRTIVMQIFALILMFTFVKKPSDYMIYAVISVVASSGAEALNIIYRKKYCQTHFTFSIDWRKHLKPIILMFSVILTQVVYTNSDVTMLGWIKGDTEVGLYSVSTKIYIMVDQLIASIAFVVMPRLSNAFAGQDYTKINKLMKYAVNYIIILGIPCIIGLNMIAPQLIYSIAGAQYQGAALSLHILTLALAFSYANGVIMNMVLIPSGRESICLRAGIISALLNILLNLLLIPQWGLNAAAGTTAVAEFTCLIYVSRYIDKDIHIDGLYNMLKAPVVGGIAIILFISLIKYVINNPYFITCISIIGSTAIYGTILLLMKNNFIMNIMHGLGEK